MSKLRKIKPMTFPGTKPSVIDGSRPVMIWVDPLSLYVDGSYQRDLTPRSVSLIRDIYREFAWTKIKPPIAVKVDSGYRIIDGQHTAIAAASIGLKEIPIFIVDAPEIIQQAQAFVAHNRNRLTITSLDIHRALVAGGEPLAIAIDAACKRTGVNFRYIGYGSKINIGDTSCISIIRRIFSKQGPEQAEKVLTILVRAKLAPISEAHLLAAASMISESVPDLKLYAVIRIGAKDDLINARTAAARKELPVWVCLKEIWTKRLTTRLPVN